MSKEHDVESKAVLDNQDLIQSNEARLNKITLGDEVLRLRSKKKNSDGQGTLSCGYK